MTLSSYDCCGIQSGKEHADNCVEKRKADELQRIRLLLENALANDVNGDDVMSGYKQDIKSLNLEGTE